MIEFTRFQLPIGKLSILAVKEGVVRIFSKNESMEELKDWGQGHLGMGIAEGANLDENGEDCNNECGGTAIND